MITVNDAGTAVSASFDAATIAGVQQVLPKIIAEWKNSKSLDNVSVTVSPDYTTAQKKSGQIGDYFDVRQVANGWDRQSVTWAILGDKDVDGRPIRADGSWHALPEENKGIYEFGWRSTVTSETSKSFLTDPVITMTFDEEKINYIDIYTSEYSGAVKEYTLQYRDTNNAYQTVASNHTLSKGTHTSRHILDSGNTIDVTGVKLTIHKTHNASDYARIHEISPVYETDISEHVVSCTVSKNREIHDTTLPLGGIAANDFQVQLDNTDHSFTIGSTKLYGAYTNKDVKFTVSMGWRISESPDVFEYINCGTYWVDEWKQSSNMTMDVRCRDYTRFMTDRDIDGGFIVKNSDAASALRMLVAQNNFPRADFQALYPYQTAVKQDGAIAHYRFNEGAASGSASPSASVTPTTGLVARWWLLGDLSGHSEDLLRALFPYDLQIQQGILGYAGKELIDYSKSPALSESSTVGSASGYAANYTDKDPSGQDDFYHTVIEGFFIPPSSGDYTFRVTIENGGVRLYMGGSSSRYAYESTSDPESMRRDMETYKGEIRIDKWFNNQSSVGHESPQIPLYANKAIPIRLEAFHVKGDFSLKLERKIGSGSWAAVSPAETTTDVAFDVSGGRNDFLSTTSIYEEAYDANTTKHNYSSQNRNHGIYTGDPLLQRAGSMPSDPKDAAVAFSNQATTNVADFVTIPYDASLDLTLTSGSNYTGSFSLEAVVNFTAFVTGDGVYAGNLDNSTSGTGTKGVGLFFKNGSHGVRFINDAGNVEEAKASSSGSLTEWVHAVATYDGTHLKYYFNGTLVETVTTAAAPAAWLSTNFVIGNSLSYSGGVQNNYLRGSMDEFAIYKKALTAEQVRDHYYTTQISELRVHPYLFGDQNAFEIAGQIATGDLGMFYFDEFGKFRYDHFNRLHEPGIPEHTTAQVTLSDSVNIKDAERRIELLANKVTIEVNPTITKNIGITSLWRAPSPSSVTVTKVASGVTLAASDTAQLLVDSTTNPPWPTSGYFKIEDEIIKYEAIEGSYFKTLTRAQFGTDAAEHTAGKKVKESRFFQFKWSQVPAADIREPFIAAIEFETPDLVSIDRFIKKPYGGEIVLSATENVPIEDNVGQVVFLDGKNDYTEIIYFSAVSGRAISNGGSINEITTQSANYSESIRKYGIKEIKINNRFFSEDEYAKRIAEFLLSKMENGSPILDINVIPQPRLQLGDRVKISRIEQFGISNRDYWVIESKIEYTGGVSQKLTLREAS